MKIGISELIVIFLVALFVLGPDKLPYYAKKLGEGLAMFRKYSAEATKDIKESIVEPLEEAQRPLKEAIEPIAELDKSIRDNVRDVQKSFADIGKTKPKQKETDDAGPQGTPVADEAAALQTAAEEAVIPAEPAEAAFETGTAETADLADTIDSADSAEDAGTGTDPLAPCASAGEKADPADSAVSTDSSDAGQESAAADDNYGTGTDNA